MKEKLLWIFLVLSLLLPGCSGKEGLKEAEAPLVKPAAVQETGFKATLNVDRQPSLLFVNRSIGKFRLEKEGKVYLGSLNQLGGPEELLDVDRLAVLIPDTSTYAIYSSAAANPIRAAKTPAEKRRLRALNELLRGFGAAPIQLILSHPCQSFQDQLQTHPECQVEELGVHKRFTHKSTLSMKAMFGGTKDIERYWICDYDPQLGIILSSDSNLGGVGQWQLTGLTAEEPSPALFEIPSGYTNTLDLEAMDQTPGPLSDRKGEHWRLNSYEVWDFPSPPLQSLWLITKEVATLESDHVEIVSGYPLASVDFANPPFVLPERPSQGGNALEVRAWASKAVVGEHFITLNETTAAFARKGRLVQVHVRGVSEERLLEICAEVDQLVKNSVTPEAGNG